MALQTLLTFLMLSLAEAFNTAVARMPLRSVASRSPAVAMSAPIDVRQPSQQISSTLLVTAFDLRALRRPLRLSSHFHQR